MTGYTVIRGNATTAVAGRTTAGWADTTAAANTGYAYVVKSVNSGGASSGVTVNVPACP